MSKKKDKDQRSGGMGKVVLVAVILLAVGGAAFWFLLPDQFESQLAGLKGLLGR